MIEGALASRCVRLRVRELRDGDAGLAPDSSATWESRRASGSARAAARLCLRDLGGPADALLARAAGGYPQWPVGFAGSLAHDETAAVAVAARTDDMAVLGVDIEPVAPLPADVFGLALSAQEQRAARVDAPIGRAIFAAKEAVYKAVNPFDGSKLEYDDIAINMAAGLAALRDGRSLRLVFVREAKWIVVAFADETWRCVRRVR